MTTIRRTIGRDGRSVNAIGLGCMGMSAFYGAPMADADGIKLLHEAIDLGVDHFDTAEMYGMNNANEKLLGSALHDRRDKVFIATKFGPRIDYETQKRLPPDGSPANAKRALEASLKYLQTDHVDLWYLHRRDFSRPIEETVGAMAEFVKQGKVKAIGLSEVGADTLRAAANVHPIAAVQSEFSIFTRFVEDEGILAACRDVGSTLVAYSPLGRGMLTGAHKEGVKTEGFDFRTTMAPRFAGEALQNNLALVEEIERVGKDLGATPGQVALAWVLARADNIVTIPGTTKLANLKSNIAASDVIITPEAMKRLDGLAARVKGERYNEEGMKAVNG